MDEVTPFVFKIGDQSVQVKNEEKAVKLVNEFLSKNTPKMDEYLHQDWTEDTYEKVADAIRAAIPQRPILEMILEKSKDQKMNALIRSRMSTTRSNNPVAESDPLDFGNAPAPAKSKPAPATEPVSANKDEYDDLFKDL